ncbi:MAG: aminotransferase class III-fold pyridoxal phosphate-dependent enzyme [Clostridia bacterium]|nr:aminotransferase class III-fold pyridoxal phosphate-dependent enzyme [Clostridia bacterium]
MSNLQERDRTYVAGTYKRFPVEIASGKGSLYFDTAGKRYIDLGTGIAVNSFGAADDVWQQAVIDQIGKVQHTSNLYYTEPCVRLAEMLCQRTGMKKVFFGNSGAEANECAIKVARKWAAEERNITDPLIVTLKGSFHGRTLTTLAATGQEHYHELFQPLTPGFVHVTAGDAEELARVMMGGRVAAVLVECIQGEGGVIPLTQSYAAAVAELTQRCGALLMVDEVQTGNGRTGTLYAYEQYGLKPDVVTTAKGLAGGLPLGAALLGERVEKVLGYGDHGSTFGGNPVCCAAACSVLSRIDDDLLAEVRKKGNYLRERFTGAPGIREVTGLGLMLGLVTERPAGEVVADCMAEGILCLTAKNKVRLLPALNIPWELLEEAADGILRVAGK